MQSTKHTTIYSILTDFLASNPSPQEIVAYQMPQELVQRAHDLLERNTEEELRREELLDFLRFEEMMSMLKLKTQLKG